LQHGFDVVTGQIIDCEETCVVSDSGGGETVLTSEEEDGFVVGDFA
jgi:hypothetical protein